MTTAVDYKSAPSDYDQLYRTYRKYVVNLVGRFGIEDHNREDVASEILTKFMERGFLEKFDPDLTFEYQGEMRPARFRSFLSRFVVTYVRGHYDKQKRLAHREAQIFDMPMRNSEPHETWGVIYGEAVASHEDDVVEAVMEQDIAQGLVEYLGKIPRRSATDTCDLVALFTAVRSQVLATGGYDVATLKDQFGISSTAMHQWMWMLKAHLAAALGRPVPAKRRRTTKPRTVES